MKTHPDANTGNTWIKNHPERMRYYRRGQTFRKHGITREQYDELYEKQGGKCANPRCDAQFPNDLADHRNVFHIDHDHLTGRVRGLLCAPCNKTLGQIQDDADRLLGLIEYLRVESLN